MGELFVIKECKNTSAVTVGANASAFVEIVATDVDGYTPVAVMSAGTANTNVSIVNFNIGGIRVLNRMTSSTTVGVGVASMKILYTKVAMVAE